MGPSVNSDCICSGHICKFRLLCAHLSNLDCNAPICQIQIAFAMGPSVKFRLHLQWAYLSNSDCICNGPIYQIQIAFAMGLSIKLRLHLQCSPSVQFRFLCAQHVEFRPQNAIQILFVFITYFHFLPSSKPKHNSFTPFFVKCL